MPIRFETDPEKQLTIFKVTGMMTEADTLSALRSFYEVSPTLNALWDMHKANLSVCNKDAIFGIMGFVSRHAHLRKGGKSAFVSEKDLAYGISRMAEALGDTFVIEYRSFRSTEEAMEWLTG